jgi:hypothetical protein
MLALNEEGYYPKKLEAADSSAVMENAPNIIRATLSCCT